MKPSLPHDLARLGRVGELSALLDRDPAAVHAPGMDGTHPLHFARDIPTATLLLDRGARIDARDEDHDSTPAQWRIREAPDVTRFLLGRGATPDLFLAAALGDLKLAKAVHQSDPTCVKHRIGNNSGPFPGIGHGGRGGTILQWTLGFNLTPHEVALRNGHRVLFEWLIERTPLKYRFLIACTLADRPTATALLREQPDLLAGLEDEDRALLAKFCWETNLDPEAVRLMLDLGFPIDVPERNHGYLPLHNAAWCGHAGLVELLLQRGHPVSVPDPSFSSTPLGWALHSCLEAKCHPEGNFARVLELLLDAGATIPPGSYPTGSAELDAVLGFRGRQHPPPGANGLLR